MPRSQRVTEWIQTQFSLGSFSPRPRPRVCVLGGEGQGLGGGAGCAADSRAPSHLPLKGSRSKRDGPAGSINNPGPWALPEV